MINVIASIEIKDGMVADFIEIFKANVPNVKAEKGCVEYTPTLDVNSGLPPQSLDKNIVTIIEKWETLEALLDHIKAPHMLKYKEKVKDIVIDVSLKILQEA